MTWTREELETKTKEELIEIFTKETIRNKVEKAIRLYFWCDGPHDPNWKNLDDDEQGNELVSFLVSESVWE